jgi:hypothetical protein
VPTSRAGIAPNEARLPATLLTANGRPPGSAHAKPEGTGTGVGLRPKLRRDRCYGKLANGRAPRRNPLFNSRSPQFEAWAIPAQNHPFGVGGLAHSGRSSGARRLGLAASHRLRWLAAEDGGFRGVQLEPARREPQPHRRLYSFRAAAARRACRTELERRGPAV